ncbi:MAG TPA: YihY/virulence factor BrkB family protein [Pseudoclavibacter sp.]|nr:YihY/virulence factor BrkB family protein [Pseudoclavibacter sp.]
MTSTDRAPWWQTAAARWQRSLAGRVWQHYIDHRGALLAGGMTYSSLFSVFAGMWVGFSALGFFQSRNDPARTALISFINAQVPGLIDTGDGGIIAQSTLAGISTTLTWTSLIAAGGLLFTSMGWMRAGQNGVRAMFGLVGKDRGALLGQLINFATLLLLVVLIIVSTAASVLATYINTWLLSVFGIQSGPVTAVSTHVVAGAVSVILDFTIIFLFVYLLADVYVKWHVFWPRALAGAAAISALKIGAGMLAGGATSNPLLASFAVLIGFMIWLNLINQVFFVTIAWLAVDTPAQPDEPAVVALATGAAPDDQTEPPTDTPSDGQTAPSADTSSNDQIAPPANTSSESET